MYPNSTDLQPAPSKHETLPTRTGDEPEEAIQPPVPEPAGSEKSNLSQVKVYTASLPPDDYIPPPQINLQSSTSEDSDLEEVEIRKRRRRKRKVNVINVPIPDVEQNIPQTPPPLPQAFEGGKINKNKKRKLQRKRQKERLKAESLLAKGRTCPSDVYQATDSAMKQSDEHTEEEQRKKREDLLDFLQATQELYFSDSKSRYADSALMMEQVLEVLDQIKNCTLPFFEVQLLHYLKSLLILQDIERLNDSLVSFKEQSTMSLDGIMVSCYALYSIKSFLKISTL